MDGRTQRGQLQSMSVKQVPNKWSFPPLLWRLGSPTTASHGGNRPREVWQRAQGCTALKATLNRSTTCLWGRGCCVQASPLPGLPPRGLWACGNEQINLDVSLPEKIIIIIISSHFTPLFCDRSGFCKSVPLLCPLLCFLSLAVS